MTAACAVRDPVPCGFAAVDRGLCRTHLRVIPPEPEHEPEPEPEPALSRPLVRGNCLPGGTNALRPCPWVSCRWHLLVDGVYGNGDVKLSHPDVEAMPETCALDVADRDGVSLDEIGKVLNLSRERVRQIEAAAVEKLQLVVKADRP